MSAGTAAGMTRAAGPRKLVLKFWIGLDGNSIDPDTEIYQLMEEITDDEQEEYFVSRLRQPGTHLMGRCCPPPPAQARRCSPGWPTRGRCAW